jgi:IS5 family transposase
MGPAASQIGSPNEPDLLPATATELRRLNLKPRDLALDEGFFPIGVAEELPGPERVFVAGRQSAGCKRTNRRLARFRVGIEGRISHLKRRYGLRRSRLKVQPGARPGPLGRCSPTTSVMRIRLTPRGVRRGCGG